MESNTGNGALARPELIEGTIGSVPPAAARDYAAEARAEVDAIAPNAPLAADGMAKPSAVYTTAADAIRAMRAVTAAGGKMLSTLDILGASDLEYQVVPVPEWGGEVLIRSGTGTERDAFETSLVLVKGKTRTMTSDNIRAKLCQKAMINPADPALMAPQFTDDQVDALGRKSAAALSRVYNAAAVLWGLSESDVEDLAKNSGAADSGDSSGT